jgi:hypothetical protein
VLDALVVDVLLVVLDVCAVTGVLVDFSLVECMGTGIFVVGCELKKVVKDICLNVVGNCEISTTWVGDGFMLMGR